MRNEATSVSSASRYKAMAINQCVVNEGTEEELVCHAYRETKFRRFVFLLLTFLTLGLVLLLFYWKPAWKVRIRGVVCDFDRATHLILEDKYERQHVKSIKLLNYHDRSPCSSVETVIELKQTNVTDKLKSDGGKDALTVSDFEANDAQPKRFFEHKFQKYFWASETFLSLRGLDYGCTVDQLKGMCNGLGETERVNRRKLFGNNSITVEITPLFIVLFSEILNPFYVFQLFSIVVWCIEEYFLFAAIIFVLSLISISVSLYMTRKQNKMINEMSSGSGTVFVLSGERCESRDSSELLPGDVIELQGRKDTVWCDMVLLSGSCVVSESMLTGESTPVLKTPLVCGDSTTANDFYDPSRHKQHTIYGGTKVVDLQRSQSEEFPRALVLRTGFYTEKGKMIESMLSPTPMDYKFYKDSLRFILIMVVFGLIGGVIAITVLSLQGASARHVITRVLDLITIVVPPGLPAALTIATIFAHRRLRLAKIFCISPPRINISGKINCMCFDKTGTLTENDLKLWGILPCRDNESQKEHTLISGDTVHEYSSLPDLGEVGESCLYAMASCHSLVNIDGKILGDPADLELFQATKWNFQKSSEAWSEGCSAVLSPVDAVADCIGLVRVFQFNSVLKRMSVVTTRKGSATMTVYAKGAPETITKLCKQNTVPANFGATLRNFTKQGYRVLALATRDLDDDGKDVSCLERTLVESDLRFLGFVILMSPLKPKTGETILSLHSANIRTVMSTGDNLETAMYVARKCHMLTASEKVVIVEAQPLQNAYGIKVTFSTEADIAENKSPRIKTQLHTNNNHSIEDGFSSGYSLALTGDTFSLLRTHAKDLLKRILVSACVFARMKPDHKRHLVEGLQEIGYIVGMCGDGANDCRALKSAHAGVAIADAETSIVAPFTSMEKSISCCIKVIREGRAALVTSFGMIKYLCIYSFVQYLTLIILYTINSYMSDIQFLFADIGVTGAVTLLFALAGAAKTLAKKPPHLSLVSPVMLSCLLLQILLLIVFQIAAFTTLKQQSWHTPLVSNMTHPKENISCEENTVMFYTACFQYLTLAFIFYKGYPYRLPLYRNYAYFIVLILLSIWVIVMFFAAVPPIDSWFSLKSIDLGFKFILLAYYAVHLVCAILVEKILLDSESFKRVLDHFIHVCECKLRGSAVTDNESENTSVSYEQLKREMLHDPTWPPVNSEMNYKT